MIIDTRVLRGCIWHICPVDDSGSYGSLAVSGEGVIGIAWHSDPFPNEPVVLVRSERLSRELPAAWRLDTQCAELPYEGDQNSVLSAVDATRGPSVWTTREVWHRSDDAAVLAVLLLGPWVKPKDEGHSERTRTVFVGVPPLPDDRYTFANTWSAFCEFVVVGEVSGLRIVPQPRTIYSSDMRTQCMAMRWFATVMRGSR